MLSVYVPTQNHSHGAAGESTFLVDRQLTGAWDALAEYAGDFPQVWGPRHLLHSELPTKSQRSIKSICMLESGFSRCR